MWHDQLARPSQEESKNSRRLDGSWNGFKVCHSEEGREPYLSKAWKQAGPSPNKEDAKGSPWHNLSPELYIKREEEFKGRQWVSWKAAVNKAVPRYPPGVVTLSEGKAGRLDGTDKDMATMELRQQLHVIGASEVY